MNRLKCTNLYMKFHTMICMCIYDNFYCKKGSSLDTQVRLKRCYKIFFFPILTLHVYIPFLVFQMQVSVGLFAWHVQVRRMVDFIAIFLLFLQISLLFSFIFYSIYLSLSLTHTNTPLSHKLLDNPNW